MTDPFLAVSPRRAIAAETSVRWMISLDMPAVVEIERASFDHPWSDEDFRDHIRQRNCSGLVHETGDHVDGFIVYEMHERRLQIVNMAVHPLVRRQSVGTAMIAKVKNKLAPHRRRFVRANLFESNLAGLLFLRRLGFLAVRLERRACELTGDDGIVMEFHL